MMSNLIWLWDYIMCYMILREKETMDLQHEREENESERPKDKSYVHRSTNSSLRQLHTDKAYCFWKHLYCFFSNVLYIQSLWSLEKVNWFRRIQLNFLVNSFCKTTSSIRTNAQVTLEHVMFPEVDKTNPSDVFVNPLLLIVRCIQKYQSMLLQ